MMEKPIQTATLPEQSPPGASPDAPGEKNGKRKKIPEEKQFDLYLYGSFSYFGQALASVLATQWAKFGSGEKFFEKATNWLSDGPLAKAGINPATARKQANTLLVATALITVGNLFLLPVKYVENHKADYVARLKDWRNQRREARGETITDEERQAQDAAIAAIRQEPKQSWASLICGRVFSLASIYAAISAVGGDRNKAMEDFSAKALSETLAKTGVAKNVAYSEKVQNFGRIAFVDFAYSIVGAGSLYAYSHFLHPKKKALEAPARDDTDPPSAEKRYAVKPAASYRESVAKTEDTQAHLLN